MRHHLLKEPHLLAGRSPGCRVRGMEEPAAGGRSLLLPVRGRPLREGKGGWASGEPGSAGSLGREGRRLQRDPRCGGLRHRERSYLPGDVPLPQEQGSLECVELVVSDDHKGLKAAITRHFQGASWQRCQVHYVRNLLGMISFAKRKELGADLRAILAATSREQALGIVSSVANKWLEKGNEKVAEHLEEHLEECLSCLAFPESHRRRIRTTNGLERLNQEIKRRTRVVRIFPNGQSCPRLVTALAVEQSEEWLTSRRYLDVEELREPRYRESESEEVVAIER